MTPEMKKDISKLHTAKSDIKVVQIIKHFEIDKMKSNLPVSEGINWKCIKTYDVQFFHALLFLLSFHLPILVVEEPLDCHNAIASSSVGLYPSETLPQLRTKTRQTKSIRITWRWFEDEEKGNRYTVTWYSAIQCSSFRILYNNKNKKRKKGTHIISLSPRMETHVVSRYSIHIPRNEEYVCGCCSKYKSYE